MSIEGDNDAPKANTAPVSYPIGGGNVTINALSYATDIDTNDSLTLTNVRIISSGHNSEYDSSKVGTLASVSVVNGKIIFSAGDEYTYLGLGEGATVQIAYTVKDEGGLSSDATAEVTVLGVNDAPTAVDDTLSSSILEDTSRTINVATLLANDTDIDGDTLTLESVQSAQNGTVTLSDDGLSINFTPDKDYSGNASFTYTINDGNAKTATATVNLNIEAVNDAPNAYGEHITKISDKVISYPEYPTQSSTAFTFTDDVDILATEIDKDRKSVV